MLKSKINKAVIIGICCIFLSSNAFAAMPIMDFIDTVPRVGIEIDNEIIELQRKIDRYVFVDHSKDIAEAGFKVTNTAPKENYVEIGILPYNEGNADYLYNLFGTEKIKVVEGVQAELLPLAPLEPKITPPDDIEVDDIKVINKDLGIIIQVDGQRLELDVKPFIENNRALIPLRGVMEKLGAEVEWIADKKLLKINTVDTKIELVAGDDTAKVIKNIDGTIDEKDLTLDVPAKIIDGHTFIPGRFVTETLGAKVFWDNNSRTVSIDTINKKVHANDPLELENEIGISLEEMGKAISIDSIKEMKMYNLMQEEVKTFSADEIEKIIDSLNTSSTYNGAYITLLAGNNINISFKDGSSIHLTSFGSKDHVVMNGEIDGEYYSYCILNYEVGGLLLSDVEL